MIRIEAETTDPSNVRAGLRATTSRLPSPLLVLAAALAACIVLLVLPVSIPVGPMFWDLVVYIDGAQRVLSGQIPSIDFFAPVGPIGYWLAAAGTWAFPNAQPLLLVQWSIFALTVPLMVPVLLDVDRRSRAIAFALLVPFLAFQIMPMNVEQYSTFPSTDGYGIYNRHTVNLLYVLTAALVFARSQTILLLTIFLGCLFLFLMKVTGFLAGGLLCLFAFLAGRIALRTAIASAFLFLASLALLQLFTSVPLAYAEDILTLVGMNESSLAPRFLQAASLHFGVFGSGSLLVLALIVLERGRPRPTIGTTTGTFLPERLTGLLDRPVFWLAVSLAAGLFFETQNTGGQAFVFVWPVLLAILLDTARLGSRSTILVLSLVAATALPPFVNTTHRFARAMIGQLNYEVIESRHLGTLGAVSQRREAIERAESGLAVYAAHPETYQDFADRRLLPGWSLYSDLDFQIGWLLSIDEGADAILAYEAANDVRFETIMVLNFANAFPTILDRQATRHIAIGADPFRAVPPLDAEATAAVAATDLILYPTCPITMANEQLRTIYAPAMQDHREIRLSPCWIGYVRP